MVRGLHPDDGRGGPPPRRARCVGAPRSVPTSLADFTYRSGHLELLRRRRDFFEEHELPYLCLWWIPEGTIPTVEEAVARLDQLRSHGPTPTAFTFRHRVDPGDAE